MDLIHKPKHYCFSKFEPKDVIRAWGLNFNLGNAVKYVARAGRKGDIIEDLKKAKEYLTFEIDALREERGLAPSGIRISEVIGMSASEFVERFSDLQNGSGLHDAIHYTFVDDTDTPWVLTLISQDAEPFVSKGYTLRLHFERLRIKGQELISANEFDLTLRN